MKFRKLNLLIAVCMISVILSAFAGCGNETPDDEDLIARVIDTDDSDYETSDSDYNYDESRELPDVTTVPRETETHVIAETDKDGSAVTDAFGNAVVSVSVAPAPVATTTTARPLSENELEKMLTQGTTAVTNVVTASNIKGADKYAYNTLTAAEKKMYDDILKSAETMMWNISGYEGTSIRDWTRILGLVFNQEPQLFWLNHESRVGMIILNETDPDTIASMQKQIDAVVNPLLNEAKGKSTTFDKLKVFHDWIVLNCSYGTGDKHNSTIYGTFVLKQAQCAGYAKGMKYLCDRAGINSMVVTGTNGKGVTHAWNVIDVDGAWYNLDSMWNDPIFPTPIPGYIRNTFFLVPDKWIHGSSHHDINDLILSSGSVHYFNPPACTETAKNYFTVRNLVFSDKASADKEIKAQIDKVVAANGRVIELRIDNKQVFDEVYKNLKEYQTYAQSKSPNVKGLSDTCNHTVQTITLTVIYN